MQGQVNNITLLISYSGKIYQPLHSFLDDQFILNFLRGSKFSLQETQKKLDIYYTIRTEFSQYLTNRDPFMPEIQELLDLG